MVDDHSANHLFSSCQASNFNLDEKPANEPTVSVTTEADPSKDLEVWNKYYDDNKQALKKGCISPFHISPEMTKFLFSKGGEWTYTPNKGKTNKGIKFPKAVKLSKANTKWPPKKKAKKSFKTEVASWTMNGCKKQGKLKCNFKKPPTGIVMHFSSKLEFKCGKNTQVFQCLKTRGQWNLESCKKGKKACKKVKDRNPKTGKLNPFPYIKIEKPSKSKKAPKPPVQFPLGFKKMFKDEIETMKCK